MAKAVNDPPASFGVRLPEHELIRTDNGKWAFVGRVDPRLVWQEQDGSVPTAERLDLARQFGAGFIRPPLRSRVYESPEAAIAAAADLGIVKAPSGSTSEEKAPESSPSRSTPRKGTPEREALEAAVTKAEGEIRELDAHRPRRGSKKHWEYQSQHRAATNALIRAKEQTRRAELEDRIEIGDPAQKVVAQIRLITGRLNVDRPTAMYRPTDVEQKTLARMWKELARAVGDGVERHPATSGLKKAARDELTQNLLDEFASDLIVPPRIFEHGLDRRIAARFAELRIDGMDGLCELTGHGERSGGDYKREIEKAPTWDDLARMLAAAQADNEKGLKLRAEHLAAEKVAAKKEAARVASLREPPAAADLAEVYKLTAAERRVLEWYEPDHGKTATAILVLAGIRRDDSKRVIGDVERRLMERELIRKVGDGYEYTDQGLRLAQAASKQAQRLEIGVPFAEYRASSGRVDAPASCYRQGWIAGTYSGRPYYSDGRFLVLDRRTPPGALSTAPEPSIAGVVKLPEKTVTIEPRAYIGKGRESRNLAVVVLSDCEGRVVTAANPQYFDHIRRAHPGATMRRKDSQESGEPILFEKDGKVVAVVMPMMFEVSHARHPAHLAELLKPPGTPAPSIDAPVQVEEQKVASGERDPKPVDVSPIAPAVEAVVEDKSREAEQRPAEATPRTVGVEFRGRVADLMAEAKSTQILEALERYCKAEGLDRAEELIAEAGRSLVVDRVRSDLELIAKGMAPEEIVDVIKASLRDAGHQTLAQSLDTRNAGPAR